jgi:Fur family ferric uptake transcriptional regulator
MGLGAPPVREVRCAAVETAARVTPRGRRVLGALAGRETPLTAQQLHAHLRDAGVRMGLTTVYRALRALTGAGLVHEFRGGEEATYRACSPSQHTHLICAHCGRVQEHRPTGLTDTLEEIRRTGFHITSSRIEIYGLCGQCEPPTRGDYDVR